MPKSGLKNTFMKLNFESTKCQNAFLVNFSKF